MKKIFLLFSIASMFAANAQVKQDLKSLIDANFQLAAQQYKLLENHTPDDKMPKTFIDGKSESSGIDWWTSGFFPGSLWLIYEANQRHRN